MSKCYASFILMIVVASFTANAFPITSPLDLVEFCYYDTAEWYEHHDTICHEIANRTSAFTLPSKMLLPLQESYASYARNEKLDRQLVLDCFMHYRNLDQNTFCWKFSNQSNGQLSRRELIARTYFDELNKFQGKVDECEFFDEHMLPLPSDCQFLDDMELVEHCFQYHQFSQYLPCQNISWPKIAAPTDARSMFIYSAWKNVSVDFEDPIEEFRMGMEGIPDPMAIVMDCLYKNEWLKDSNSICHDIAEPVQGKGYDQEFKQLEMLYTVRKWNDEQKDCKVYHQNDNYSGCQENDYEDDED